MQDTGEREATARGVVNLAQEGRFQLRCDDGGHRLFVLARDAPVEPQDLPDLVRHGRPVEVRYVEARDLVAFVARDIRYCESGRNDR